MKIARLRLTEFLSLQAPLPFKLYEKAGQVINTYPFLSSFDVLLLLT